MRSGSASTELFDLDLSVPAVPRLVGHTTWSGHTLSLRQYGDTSVQELEASLGQSAATLAGQSRLTNVVALRLRHLRIRRSKTDNPVKRRLT